MSVDAIQEEINTPEPKARLPFPTSTSGRVIYGLFITLAPAFDFLATALLKPLWQDAKLSSYIMLLLFPRASAGFILLLAYSVICYLLLMYEPSSYAPKFIVRAGIYTGVLLALHYTILSLIYALEEGAYLILLVWIFPIVFPPFSRWVMSNKTLPKIRKIVSFVVIALALVLGVSAVTNIMTLPMLMIMAAPFWSFLLSWRAATWLYKTQETRFTLLRGVSLTAWLAVYAGSWRYDILKMYELYSQLPTRPPDCYIATVAAKGHPQFVRAQTMQLADENFLQVNQQLQILKCAELALLVMNPKMHKLLRKVYDRIGEPFARRIQNPFLADVAYLFLKPCEWLVSFVLRWFIPEIDSISKRMYIG